MGPDVEEYTTWDYEDLHKVALVPVRDLTELEGARAAVFELVNYVDAPPDIKRAVHDITSIMYKLSHKNYESMLINDVKT